MSSLSRLCDRYTNFALNHYQLVGEIETGLRWISYFLPSRSRDDAVLSELVYCASKLLVLINDTIFEKYITQQTVKNTVPEAKVLKFISVLNCAEVFIEIASAKFGGSVAKWIIITCVQLTKILCRFLLIFKYKVNVIQSIVNPRLDRKKIEEYLKLCPPIIRKEEDKLKNGFDIKTSSTFTLSSGRTIKTLTADSNHHLSKKFDVANGGLDEMKLVLFDTKKITAEIIYTIRPLVHLISMGYFGQNSWPPWLLSVGLDLASNRILSSTTLLPAEAAELRQRNFLLLVYLLRSPFYDKYSKKKIINLLKRMKRIFPFGNFIWNSLLEYARVWDRIYFYSWDS